jgi:hypothetical protein
MSRAEWTQSIARARKNDRLLKKMDFQGQERGVHATEQICTALMLNSFVTRLK